MQFRFILEPSPPPPPPPPPNIDLLPTVLEKYISFYTKNITAITWQKINQADGPQLVKTKYK
jgi:hypothetical protein